MLLHPTSAACRLLIVDDHPALAQGLATWLAQEPDLAVVGHYGSGSALLAALEAAPPEGPLPADVLLLDLHLPPPDGLALLPMLRQRWPALRVLVFSMAASRSTLAQVKAAGASGFVQKSADATDLLSAIRRVHMGQLAFPEDLSEAAATEAGETAGRLRLSRLSERERQVVFFICAGLTTRAIAEQLCLSELTVGTHRRNILQKLELPNTASLVALARQQGLY
ncbi:response regulator transcription factor [Hymenobacter saemangeumensis]|uniref:Response regulator transcription factor n=1 Tax=Hymenobacter saemangeumensis TaxID=1084522 RepID=A0ABP8ILQ6_9BACT